MQKFIFYACVVLCGVIKLNAQNFDTSLYLRKVDSIMVLIDSKKDLMEFIVEGQVMNSKTQKVLSDGFAKYFYHDKQSNALLKVIDNPIKKEEVISTFYISNDSLVCVKTVNRQKVKSVNLYYFINKNLLKTTGLTPRQDFKSLVKNWTELFEEHKKYCP